jgi:hypothetical protein
MQSMNIALYVANYTEEKITNEQQISSSEVTDSKQPSQKETTEEIDSNEDS